MNNKKTPKKAVLLARVSTKRQEDEGRSLDTQQEKLRTYAKDRDLDVVEEFIFHESAGKKIRKKFEEMISYIKENPEIRAIVAYKVDRMTRNFRDAVLIDDLRNLHDIELHFVDDRLVLDKNARSHEVQHWDLKVFLAKQYLNDLHDYGTDTWRSKIDSGEWSGAAPCGYLNVDLDKNKKWIEIDTVRGPLVKKGFELYATGKYSIEMLAKKLRKLGLTTVQVGRPISKAQVASMLDNPFYYGVMRFKGNFYPHKYHPLISKWLFNKCQEVKARWNKKPFKYGAKEFAFKGVIVCSACGRLLSSYTKKEINYVRCHGCKGTHVREEAFLAQVRTALEGFSPSMEKVEEVKQQLKLAFDDESEFYRKNVARLKSELKKIDNRMEQMYKDRLDGCITHEFYDRLVLDFQRQRSNCMMELGSHQKADSTFQITGSYLLDLAHRSVELFESSQPAQKRQLLKLILANCTAEGEKLVFNLKAPFEAMRCAKETKKWLPRLDSNQ